jgi:hypothetical protein
VEDLRHLVSRVPYAGRDPFDAAVLLAESTGRRELSLVRARHLHRFCLRMVHGAQKGRDRAYRARKSWQSADCCLA